MRLKGEVILRREEFEDCRRVFTEKVMHALMHWLHYYGNADVAPGLEAFEKIRDFYLCRVVDRAAEVYNSDK